MNVWRALGSGIAGACAVTLLNETARRVVPNAPHLELLGMRAVSRSLKGIHVDPPEGHKLYGLTLVGDIVSNGLFYSLIGMGQGKRPWLNGSLLGLGAGLASVVLPDVLKLGRQPDEKRPRTQAMMVAWYLAGGLAAAAACTLFQSRSHDD